jgi:hypothetical protein
LKQYYSPSSRKVELVDVPAFNFAMVDGAIEAGHSPGSSPAFQLAMQALYGISYTLKFMSKLNVENPQDYVVMGLEGLWWVEDGKFDIRKPDNWKYTVMIMQPEHITQRMFQEGLVQLKRKKPSPSLDWLRFERFQEGLCVQTMHIGPYADEPATVARMDAFAEANGYTVALGKHHEIYMGDPRKGDPAKMKTVLRHPVKKK